MKDSIVIFTENKDIIDELTNEQAGILFKAIMAYQMSGEAPEIADAVARIVFMSLKKQIDRCNENYEERKRKRSEAGKKGMAKRWASDNNAITNDNNVITSDNNVMQDDNKNNLKEKEKDKDKEKEKVKRHKYGEYHHVLLTDEQYMRLCQDHGKAVIDTAIKVVDEYCQTSGKTYKDYNLVLRNWGIERAKKDTASTYSGWSFDDLERRLIQ